MNVLNSVLSLFRDVYNILNLEISALGVHFMDLFLYVVILGVIISIIITNKR